MEFVKSCSFYVYISTIYSGCSSTGGTHDGPHKLEWFSLELPTKLKVTKVQIARRMDECGPCWRQGQDVKITIGPSKAYDPNDNEPTCLPVIRDLTRASGLQDYVCTDNPPAGKFVKLSRKGWLVLCEVKVFGIQESVDGKWKEAEDKTKAKEKAWKMAEAKRIAEEKAKKEAEAEKAKIMDEKTKAEKAKMYQKYLDLKKKKEEEDKARKKAAEKAKQMAKSKTKVAQSRPSVKREGGRGCYKIQGNSIPKRLHADSPKS